MIMGCLRGAESLLNFINGWWVDIDIQGGGITYSLDICYNKTSPIELIKGLFMAEKKLTDLKTFIENVNKKDSKRNGKKVKFGFTKRKRHN